MADNTPKWEDTVEVEASTPSWDDTVAIDEAPAKAAAPITADAKPASALETVEEFNPLPYIGGVGLTAGKSLANLVGADFEGGYKGGGLDGVKKAYGENVQQLQDANKAMRQGATLGGEDELVGGVQAVTKKAMGDKDDLSDLYRRYQQLEEKRYDQAKLRNPETTTAGELAGGVAAGLATAGVGLEAQLAKQLGTMGIKEGFKQGAKTGLKNLGKAALASGVEAGTYGAIQGGLSSENNLEQPVELADDVKDSAIVGGIFGAGTKALPLAGMAAGKAYDKAADIGTSAVNKLDETRQAKLAFDRAKAGMGNRNEYDAVTETDESIRKLLGRFTGAEKKAGSAVGAAKAQAGKVNVSPVLEQAAGDLQAYARNRPDLNLESNPAYKKILDKVFNLKNTDLTAEQASLFRDEMGEFAKSIKDERISKIAGDVQGAIKGAIDMDPAMKVANRDFSQTKRFGRETLGAEGKLDPRIAGDMPQVDDDKLQNSIKWAMDKLSTPGSDPEVQKEVMLRMSQSPELMKALNVKNVQELENLFKNDLMGVRNILTKGAGVGSAVPRGWLEALSRGVTDTGRKALYETANIAGRGAGAVTSKAGKLAEGAKRLYSLPEQGLRQLSDDLIRDPNTAKAGKFLQDALNNKNIAQKNAALFSLQQDPKLRKQINGMLGLEESDEE